MYFLLVILWAASGFFGLMFLVTHIDNKELRRELEAIREQSLYESNPPYRY